MAHDKVELRVDITPELASRIDAMLMVDGLKARADYVVPILEKAVNYELHRATVLLRCAGINPLAASRRAGSLPVDGEACAPFRRHKKAHRQRCCNSSGGQF